MEATTLSESERLRLVSSFLGFAIGQTPEAARWFLQAKSWNLDEALFFFFQSVNQNPRNDHSPARSTNLRHEQQISSTSPLRLLFDGTFTEAKSAASRQEKWLLLSLQSRSCTLNRDTWSNDSVSRIIKANFVFLQVYDDTIEGRSVCSLYQLQTTPVVLLIDPTTGQQMHLWSGKIDPRAFLEDLVPFMDHGPRECSSSSVSRKRPRMDPMVAKQVTDSLRNMTLEAVFPPLPEEPQGSSNGGFLCRVGVRLPDGRRLVRSFNKSDPIQLLWSFCYSELEGWEGKPLKLRLAIPGASKTLEYGSNLTFEQSGLENSLITVTTWD
ncbi:PREDICTED: plant UBX domain-containing protein 7-like [Tarenaya hassleriana]|uniref:plant UBX domain-containing protein 7-like n=1 Tax=Tarenaya hassleriana TaxID=28532 RepID=UPI00053C3455|nr:PREDICTED: plant UBX domain-containing protein 7-like [Tarenaya hassleriana]